MRNKAWNRLWGITAAAVLMAGSVMSGCGSTNQEAKATPESAVSPETVSEPAESTAAETQEKGPVIESWWFIPIRMKPERKRWKMWEKRSGLQ